MLGQVTVSPLSDHDPGQSVSVARSVPAHALPHDPRGLPAVRRHPRGGGVNFAVFSRHAHAVSLVLFREGREEPIAEIPLDPA